MTLGPWLRACAERHGDREAVEVMGAAKSYAGLDGDADRLAAGLTVGIGLAVGDRAAVIMRNSLACVDAWFAMARAGIVDVPVNVAQRGDGLAYVLGQSRSQAVVCDTEFADRLAEVMPELPELRHVILRRPDGDDSTAPSFGSGVAVHELPSLYHDTAPSLPALEATDIAVILYTSGTTGPPKGAMLSHAANLAPHPPDPLAHGLRPRRRAVHGLPAVPHQRPLHDGHGRTWRRAPAACWSSASAPAGSGTRAGPRA